MGNRERIIRVVTGMLPLALVPFLILLIANGFLDLGGGEMDLIWILPYSVWALIFAISFFIHNHRGHSYKNSVRRSFLVSVGGVLLAAIVLALFGQLGVAGRF